MSILIYGATGFLMETNSEHVRMFQKFQNMKEAKYL